MKIEKIINKESTRCINVAASKVESLRINNDLQNTVRVYYKNAIGVQGSLGRAEFDELEKAAAAKLAQGIPYPETHDKVQVLNIDTAKFIFDKKDFIPKTAALLERLAR